MRGANPWFALPSCTALAVVVALAGCGEGDKAPCVKEGLGAARRAKLRIYYLGETYKGLPITNVFGSRGHWFIIYGSCDPDGGLFSDEGGCAPPYQVQSTSICERNPHRLSGPDRTTPFRGARIMPAGGGIDVYTGSTAVTLFWGDREILGQPKPSDLEPLRRLRSVDATTAPRRLPPPVAGSLQGKGTCRGA